MHNLYEKEYKGDHEDAADSVIPNQNVRTSFH